MATYSATGITLVVHKFKGTQRIASFYTLEKGKVEATITGVGKPGSKLAAAAEPLTLSRLMLAEGRNLDRLAQAEVLETFYALRNDLRRLALASYAAELVANTTEPGEPDPQCFDIFEQTLRALTATDQPDMVMWAFVVKYLELQGIGPVFDRCASCGEDLSGRAWYVPQVGGCVGVECVAGTAQGMEVQPQVRGAIKSMLTMPADRIERLRLGPGLEAQVREVLRRHIRYHIGVNMKSESFLQKMARAGGPPAAG